MSAGPASGPACPVGPRRARRRSPDDASTSSPGRELATLARRLDATRDVPAPGPRPAVRETRHDPHEVRQHGHQVQHVRTAAGRLDADQHVVTQSAGGPRCPRTPARRRSRTGPETIAFMTPPRTDVYGVNLANHLGVRRTLVKAGDLELPVPATRRRMATAIGTSARRREPDQGAGARAAHRPGDQAAWRHSACAARESSGVVPMALYKRLPTRRSCSTMVEAVRARVNDTVSQIDAARRPGAGHPPPDLAAREVLPAPPMGSLADGSRTTMTPAVTALLRLPDRTPWAAGFSIDTDAITRCTRWAAGALGLTGAVRRLWGGRRRSRWRCSSQMAPTTPTSPSDRGIAHDADTTLGCATTRSSSSSRSICCWTGWRPSGLDPDGPQAAVGSGG